MIGLQGLDKKLHPTIYVDVITYPCPNLDAGLVNLKVEEALLVISLPKFQLTISGQYS